MSDSDDFVEEQSKNRSIRSRGEDGELSKSKKQFISGERKKPRQREETTPPRRQRQRRSSLISEKIITSPGREGAEKASVNRSKSADSNESQGAKDKKREEARLRKQRSRANSTEEKKLAEKDAARIRMKEKREKLTDDQRHSTRRSDRLRKQALRNDEEIAEKEREADRLRKQTLRNDEKTAEKQREANRLRMQTLRNYEETAEKEREADRLRKQTLRNDEEKAEKERQANRLRMRRLREVLAEDEEALERQREINRQASAAYLKQQNTKVATKDGLRSQEVLNGTFYVPPLEDTRDSIGQMNIECQKCGAFKFREESNGFCCNDGKVLPDPFPKPPPKLFALWTGRGVEANILKEFAREINNSVCLREGFF